MSNVLILFKKCGAVPSLPRLGSWVQFPSPAPFFRGSFAGHLSDAVSSYERALHCRPDDAEVRVNLSEALRRLDRLDAAAAVFERGQPTVLELVPPQPLGEVIGLTDRERDDGQRRIAAA